MFSLKSLAFTASALVASVAALGSACSSPLGAGTAAAGDPYWLQSITHQGTSPFNSNPGSYAVYRNVQDYGAKGDGVTDDTAAINAAISDGGRCGDLTCTQSTTSPAVVFFPQGTYVVSTPIIAYYDTVLIGDARVPPTLKATSGFSGIAVIDADPYGAGGVNWYVNQDNFFRSVRNFVIDLTAIAATSGATGLHWQVSQATSLINIVVNMSEDSDTIHQGIFMENGSGGFLGDIIFNGGKYGFWSGNQQFTVRNITVNNAQTGIFADWNWGWTFQDVTINNCQVGFGLATGGTRGATVTIGAEAIIDAVVTNTPTFIQVSEVPGNPLSAGSGSIVINNIELSNVPTAVGSADGTTLLAGGSTTISEWVLGNVFTGSSSNAAYTTGSTTSFSKPSSLVSDGKIFGRTHPQYQDYAVSQFVSVKSNGAKGDGVTDDTAALNAIFAKYSGCSIIFFDAGVYYITDTLVIPAGTQLVGEGWAQILAGGSNFQDQTNPKVAVQVGSAGDSGILEITDIVFTTKGPSPGAIMMEWNVAESSQGSAGMWDSHFRFGGAAGTNMQSACSNTTSTASACTAAFLGLHITSGASGYFEGTWIWTADHDLDGGEELTIYAGRGLLSESAGPVWLIGVAAEHHTLYQFNFNGAKNHYAGLLQTETPYYQPNPAPPTPFTTNSAYNDPTFSSDLQAAWALYITGSSDLTFFGAGFYNFFQDYNSACLTPDQDCQTQIVNIDSASSGIAIYSLSTVASTFQISVGETGVVNQDQTINGFASTVTKWTSS